MFKERLFPMQRSSTKRKSFWISFLVVFLLSVFILGLSAVSVAFAQTQTMGSNLNTFANASGLPQMDLVTFIGNLVRAFLAIVGIILVLLIMYAGFIWMTAEGDPGKVDKAKKIMTNAVIGLIIIMASFAITTFLMGWLGKSNPNPNPIPTCPGCEPDPFRSNIGKGPIESVYPAPNQKDVNIDTLIIVTFKEPVATSTIIKANGQINTSTVQICMASSTATGQCSTDPNDAGFNINDFASTTVSSTPDNRTFVFTPNKNLGPADGKNRYFKVWLGSSITKLGKTDSIFGVGGQYAWSFQTNGKIDLNPPYVVASNIYPYADDVKDTYDNITTAATGVVTSEFSADIKANIPIKIVGKTTKYYVGQPLIVEMIGSGVDLGGFRAFVRSPSGPSIASNAPSAGVPIEFTVNSDKGTYITFNNDNAKDYLDVVYKTDGVCKIGTEVIPRCLALNSPTYNSVDLNGLIIESRESDSVNSDLGAAFPRGSTWNFTIYPPVLGDRFVIQNGESKLNKFMFVGNDEERSVITISTMEQGKKVDDSYIPVKKGSNNVSSTENLAGAINDSPANLIVGAQAQANSVIVKARQAGVEGNNIQIIRQTGNTSATASLVGGQNISYGRHKDINTNDPEDPANNSKFQITFSKAINPLSVSADSVVVRSEQNGVMATSSASISFANQYRTVVLTGTIPCGVNSCGEQIYCWTTTTPGMTPTSTKFQVNIKAASLKTCATANESWCASGGSGVYDNFGGTCGQNGRCQKTVGTQTVYYPKSNKANDGITDANNNSLNGNFNYYHDDFYKRNLGIAEGRSTSAIGGSGNINPFSLPASTSTWATLAGEGDSKAPWSNSTTAMTTGGDDFRWSFYVSSLIDLQSPLINKIEPYGDQSYGVEEGETALDPVRITFDRIMAADTFKPGWGYDNDKTTATWTQRFFVLQTITSGANPVGYWIGSDNIDSENDGWANYTQATIRHNNFDQSVSYGPLVGSGAESITQNCFLPGNGPRFANDAAYAASLSAGQTASNDCNYKKDGTNNTEGCMTDSILGDYAVSSTNPASYAHMNCASVEGAHVCNSSKKEKCAVLYFDAKASSTYKYGSWIVAKDHPTSTSGSTGCCFGTCVASTVELK